jgi:hypothetical protein
MFLHKLQFLLKPIALHLVDIFSVSSMLVGPTMLRSMMIFMMFQHLICKDDDHHTMDTVFRMFIWSFKACWTGRNPVEDWNGEERWTTRVLVSTFVVATSFVSGL